MANIPGCFVLRTFLNPIVPTERKRGVAFFCGLVMLLAALPESAIAQANREGVHVRFLEYGDIHETLVKYAGSDLPGSQIASPEEWNRWIREQDRDVRSRIDRGVEDSISNLVVYGTSFTDLPRLFSLDEAVDPGTGKLTSAARARVHVLALAAARAKQNERVEFVREFLARKGIASGQRENYLTANLVRFAEEQQEYRNRLDQATKSENKSEALAARGTLYAQRGLSVDTSLLPNLAIEDTLRVLLAKGALQSGNLRRVAVVGPGLDFTDKRDGYDFYPLQTIQPFAVMEAVERLGLGKREQLGVVTLDLNSAVNSHVARLAASGRRGRPYRVQLPRDVNAAWTNQAVTYWEGFGEIIGTLAKPLAVPEQLPTVKLRAVAISADRAARVSAVDLNIVTQTADFADGEGFDLVVATNIFVYYDHFQQAMAMSSIARMMNAGGVFVCNTPLPSAHDEKLRFLGRRTVAYAQDESYGDDIVVYQKVYEKQ